MLKNNYTTVKSVHLSYSDQVWYSMVTSLRELAMIDELDNTIITMIFVACPIIETILKSRLAFFEQKPPLISGPDWIDLSIFYNNQYSPMVAVIKGFPL
jgi:hypothetical protein